MSQQITCKACDFANVPGSKFCNNCGAKLPLGTHIICFNCGTSNPIDRVFCDHCGTRLVPEEPDPESRTKEEPASAGGKAAFSLPARRPGETGDLDPSKVPDWLKTGKMGGEPDDEDLADMELPRVEELTRKKHTDDLPEWLVDEADSDPIIRAPTIISTELYEDLLDRVKEIDLPEDDLFPQEDANLPDWLKDPGAGSQQPDKPKKPAADASQPAEKGLTDWLSDLPGEPETAPPKAAPPKADKEDSLTSWLSSQPEEPEDDWLPAKEPENDSLTAWLSSDMAEPAGTGGDARELADSLTSWLTDLPAEDEAEEEGSAAAETLEAEELADSLTGWLTDLPAEGKPETDEPAGEPMNAAGLTEWLAGEAEAPAFESLADEPAPEMATDSLTGWLSDFSDEDAADGEWPVVEEPDSGGLTARLAAEQADEGEPAEAWDVSSRLTSWFRDEEEGEQTAVSPTHTSTTQDDETDWLLEMPEEDELAFDESEAGSERSFDEAARLAAWFDSPAEPEDTSGVEHFDWLEESEQPQAAAVSSTDEILDDLNWLEESEEELTSIFQSQPSIAEEMPEWLAGVAAAGDTITARAEAEADDLEDIFRAETKAAASEIDFLRETGSLRLDDESVRQLRLTAAGEQADLSGETILSDESDWLAALAMLAPGETPADEVEAEGATPLPSSAAEELADSLPAAAEFAAEEEEEDWTSGAPLDVLDREDDALPAWISQLDATGPLPDMDDWDASEELPEWVASLRPSQGIGDSALAANISETLAGIPEELAGADLPEWLQDVPQNVTDVSPISLPADTQLSDIPDWLQVGLTPEEAEADILAGGPGALDMATGGDEWTAILADLPPVVPLQDVLPKAEIPDWVMELKPAELSGPGAKVVPSGPEEAFGPLSGLRGVVAVEPVIALPRVADPLPQFTVSAEQRQQVALLRHISQDSEEEETRVSRRAGRDISGWIRPLFALVLFAVITLGLRGVAPFSLSGDVPLPLRAANTAVNAVVGQNVLVAFEYTPAMAGELTPEAQMLLAQLVENNSLVLTLSQYTAGVTVAEQIAGGSAVHLGYLPGGAIGLRWLGECLRENANCDRAFGAPLPAGQQEALRDVALIIVLTADRQSLVNWIEQVGTPGQRPLVAGVTQALAPLTMPYFSANQLAGVLNGAPGTAVYQQAYMATSGQSDGQQLWNAQVMAQMLLIVVMISGGLVYFISGVMARRRSR